MTVLVKNSICVKILLHANIQAGKAALVRNYFSRRNNFFLNSFWFLAPLSLTCSEIFDQINADGP